LGALLGNLLTSSLWAIDLKTENTVQISGEYDDNVTAEASAPVADFLLRMFYRNNFDLYPADGHKLSTKCLFGGKKYLEMLDPASRQEDSLKGQLLLGYLWLFHDNWAAVVDSSLESEYIRDDHQFVLDTFSLAKIIRNFSGELQASIGGGPIFFRLDDDYFLGDQYLAGIEKNFNFGHTGSKNEGLLPELFRFSAIKTSIFYTRQRRIFSFADTLGAEAGDRHDVLNEISAQVALVKKYIVRLGYSFQMSHSNSPWGDFHNHKFELYFSKVLWRRLTLMLLTEWQYKHYNDMTLEDGALAANEASSSDTIQQYEDENKNLNTVDVKVSYTLSENFLFDLKYSYYYQDYQNDRFQRNLLGLGMRWKF
jgi:hypothetical protein